MPDRPVGGERVLGEEVAGLQLRKVRLGHEQPQDVRSARRLLQVVEFPAVELHAALTESLCDLRALQSASRKTEKEDGGMTHQPFGRAAPTGGLDSKEQSLLCRDVAAREVLGGGGVVHADGVLLVKEHHVATSNEEVIRQLKKGSESECNHINRAHLAGEGDEGERAGSDKGLRGLRSESSRLKAEAKDARADVLLSWDVHTAGGRALLDERDNEVLDGLVANNGEPVQLAARVARVCRANQFQQNQGE